MALRKKIAKIVSGALCVLSFAITSFGMEKVDLIAVGGPQGGAWYGLVGSIAKETEKNVPNVMISVRPGGGIGNILLLEKNEAQFGTTVSHLFTSAVNGTAPYENLNAKNLRALAHIGTSDTCLFLVKKDYEAKSIREIKDKSMPIRLVTTGKASTPALGAERIFVEYGFTSEDLKQWGGSISYMNYSDATQLITDGHVDGIIAPVVPAIIELSKTVELKMLPLEIDILDSLVSKFGYAKVIMKKDSYPWVNEDVAALGEPNILLGNICLPEEIGYQIVKLICENPDSIHSWGSHHANFEPKNAPNNVGGPLHDGAIKYYKEKGYIKD